MEARMNTTLEREIGRQIFGQYASIYTEARPDYPPRVYEILNQRCRAGTATAVFEIGPGTGLATQHLLDLGCNLSTIEPDAQLARVLRQRLQRYSPQLHIHEVPFEEVKLPANAFDLGIAAMSLHWLDPATALTKAWTLLRPGGHWAMWWTVYGDPLLVDDFLRRTNPLFQTLAHSPSQGDPLGTPFSLAQEARSRELENAGFIDIRYEEIRWQSILTREQVVSLTATFSPVAHLTEPEREKFLAEIARIVDQDFGGQVTRNFVTAIYTAIKP
jgi:SAM-dependent methyltransferase